MRASTSRVAVLAAALVAVTTGPAAAQMHSGGMGYPLDHRVELGVVGAYAWTGARQVYFDQAGELDIGSGGSFGITADFTARPGAQVELLYNRQDSKLQYRENLGVKQDVVDIALTYWHVGGLYGIPRGPLMPFASLTFGATQVDYKDKAYSDTWKFSMIFGLGAKAFVSQRFGLRGQVRFPFTFFNGGYGIGCGPGGCYTTIGGTGVYQIDLGGGAFVMF